MIFRLKDILNLNEELFKELSFYFSKNKKIILWIDDNLKEYELLFKGSTTKGTTEKNGKICKNNKFTFMNGQEFINLTTDDYYKNSLNINSNNTFILIDDSFKNKFMNQYDLYEFSTKEYFIVIDNENEIKIADKTKKDCFVIANKNCKDIYFPLIKNVDKFYNGEIPDEENEFIINNDEIQKRLNISSKNLFFKKLYFYFFK